MKPEERYLPEAPAPTEASLHETLRYLFDETQRRMYVSTEGLSDGDLSVDPGHGAMSIGGIVNHQLRLVRFMTETLKPGSTEDLPDADIGGPGAWWLDAIKKQRETLNQRFREVLASLPEPAFMEKRDGMPPGQWAEWPVLMRLLRPMADLAHHAGQVSYARRQLGKPVG